MSHEQGMSDVPIQPVTVQSGPDQAGVAAANIWFETEPNPHIVVQADGTLLDANRAARDWLGDGHVLLVIDGRLAAADTREAGALVNLIAEATPQERSWRVLEGRTPGNRTILSGRRFGPELPGGPYVGIVAQPTADFVPPERLAVALNDANLTPAEFQIVIALFQSPNSEEISDFLGLSVHTVNTHLKRIFRKVRVNSKQDLILFVMRRLVPI